MNYQIKSNKAESAYLQLYNLLRNDIIRGIYSYGAKLPSKRMIAEETKTSVITVQHALALLCDEGYVEAKERSGYFVIYREGDYYELPPDYKSGSSDEYRASTNNYIEAANQSDITSFSFNVLSKTTRKVLLDYGESLLQRSPNKGLTALRNEITKYLARNRGIIVNEEQIIIGSGAEYLYSLIAQLFDMKKVIAIEDPSYEKIEKVYKASSHQIEKLKLGTDGILSSELERSKAKILHVTPFHSYPSNVTASISKKNEYLRFVGNNGYIIEDNYDSELTVSKKIEDSLFSLSHGKNVIYINTFTKTIAPSIRVGYMVLPENLVKEFDNKLGFYSCTVPVLEQAVITEFLSSGDFERHINRIRRMRRKNGVK